MTTSTRANDASVPMERGTTTRLGWRLSWGAIFAGLLVAMGLQLVLTLLGAAIGFAAWDPNSGAGLGIGAGMWALVSMLIALFVGGATAGWVSAPDTRPFAMLHGTLVWTLATLVTVWMVASGIGAIAGATFRVVGSVVGATAGVAAHGAAAAMSGATGANGIDMSTIRSQVEILLQQTGNPALRPGSLSAQAQRIGNQATQSSASNSDLVNEVTAMVRNTASTVNREDVVNVIVARTGKSRAEAEQMADRIVALRQAASAKRDTRRQKVGATAEHVSSVTSTTLWFALLGMLLSLGAAVFGANWASKRERAMSVAR